MQLCERECRLSARRRSLTPVCALRCLSPGCTSRPSSSRYRMLCIQTPSVCLTLRRSRSIARPIYERQSRIAMMFFDIVSRHPTVLLRLQSRRMTVPVQSHIFLCDASVARMPSGGENAIYHGSVRLLTLEMSLTTPLMDKI